MMTGHQRIANSVHAGIGTAQTPGMPDEIRNPAQASGFRWAILVDDKRPAGILRWGNIDRANAIPESSLARDFMLAIAPLLRQTSARGARSTLDLAGFDRLPLVSNQGELIRVVAHNMLKEATTMENNNTQRPTHDQPTARQTRRAFTVHPGMNVISVDGAKLGLVDRLFLDHGVVTGFLVSVGPNGPRHKQLDFDKVDHLEGETIILTMNESAFGDLPDANSLDQ